MATIVDIVRLKEQGLSQRAVSKRLGISRTTVSKYWNETTNPERPRYTARPQLIDLHRDYITSRLGEYPELTARRLYKEIRKKGFQGSERTVRRYVQALRPHGHREYKPFETLPGEQAQVDWGHFGTIVVNGARYKLYAFVFTLCWSRVSYVEFVIRGDMVTFLSCMNRAFLYIGGVPRGVLFDNAKVVVTERVGNVVRFNQNLLQFALATGFTPLACWANDPESKGKVESQVKYVRSGFFYGSKFQDLDHINQEALAWCNEEANTRVHGTTNEAPFDRLLVEKGHLKPFGMPAMPFILEERRASRAGLISMEGNKYSVPSRFASRTVRFRRYEKHLELMDGRETAGVIPLVYGRGECIIQDEHYPAHQRAKSRHTPSHPLQAKFEALAPEAPVYLQGLSQSRVGTLRDQMQSIVELSSEYSPAAISQAMQRAVEFKSYGYGVLKRILARQALAPDSLPEALSAKAGSLPESLNVQVEKRDLNYYRAVGAAQ